MSETKNTPVMPFSIDHNNGMQVHIGFELNGTDLFLLVYNKTITPVDGKDTVAFVPVGKIGVGSYTSFKELEENVGHIRWSIDQMKRKLIVVNQTAINAQITSVLAERKAVADAEAAKAAALKAQATETGTPAPNQASEAPAAGTSEEAPATGSEEPALQEQNSGSEASQS